MHRVLVVTDVPWARNQVHAALTTPEFELVDVDDPRSVGIAAAEEGVDAVVVDLQVGSMGGMAVTRDVRNHADLHGGARVPVVILLDRAADGFLARRAGAAAWVTKPTTGTEIADAVRSVLAPPPPGTATGAEPVAEPA